MAARILLLFMLFCKAETNGISVESGLIKEEGDLQVISSKRQEVTPQNTNDDVRALPDMALRLNDWNPNNLDFKDDIAAKSLKAKHNPELTVKHEKRSNLTNGEVEGVISAHSQVQSSEEEHAPHPEFHLETGVSDVVPKMTQEERSKWVTESEDGLQQSQLLHSRPRRSWLWNQFFVIEEYRGPEPVLIGRVSFCCFICVSFLKVQEIVHF